MTHMAVGAAGGRGHDFILGKGGGTNVSAIPWRLLALLQGNALYPALWTARRGVGGPSPVGLCLGGSSTATADVERFPVADLVDASSGRACRSAPSAHRTPLSPLWRSGGQARDPPSLPQSRSWAIQPGSWNCVRRPVATKSFSWRIGRTGPELERHLAYSVGTSTTTQIVAIHRDALGGEAVFTIPWQNVSAASMLQRVGPQSTS